MPVATGNLYRCSIEYLITGEACANVIYIRGNDSNTTAELIAGGLQTDWVAATRLVQSNQVVYTGITVVQVVRFGAQDTAGLAIGGVVGAKTGNAEAPQLAVNVNVRTGQFGRTRRGRFFLGGVQDGDVIAGKVTSALTTDLNTMITSLTGRFIGASHTSVGQLGVFSRSRFALISNPFDEYWVPATQLAYRSVMSTMRSRKPAA